MLKMNTNLIPAPAKVVATVESNQSSLIEFKEPPKPVKIINLYSLNLRECR